MTKYLIAAIFAMAGVGLLAVNVTNNAMAINGSLVLNDLALLVAGLAILAALLSLSLAAISRHSKITAALAVLTIFGCTVTSLHYTITRVGGVSDSGAQNALAHNGAIARSRTRVSELRDLIGPQMETAARECRGFVEGKSKPQRWPKCLTARGMLQGYRAELAQQRATINSLGAARVVDPAAERISAAVGGWITPAQYRTALPLITAGSLELGVNLLLAIAGMFAIGRQRRQSDAMHARVIEETAVEINPVVKALELHGTVSNRQLANVLSWSETKASREVKKLRQSGMVQVGQDGKSKAIKLV